MHATQRRRGIRRNLTLLSALSLALAALYLFAFVNPKFFDFAMSLRLPRLGAMACAAFAIASASLVFQTVIRNRIVTPCLLGMNSLYLLVHTAVVFFLGSGHRFATDPVLAFAVDCALMGSVAALVYYVVFKRTGGNVLYVLLIGTVLSTFFSSAQSSLTRIMDPNEYDALLNSLVANFTNVNAAVLLPSAVLLAAVALWLRRDLAQLDVIALGKDAAVNLGVDYDAALRRLLVGVSLYIAVATALVGPISFLGLITSNLARNLFATFRHTTLVAASVAFGFVILIGGQFLVEHVMTYAVPVSVFVTIGGGLYFLYLVLTAYRR